MWNLKYDTHEIIYETETDSDIENRLVVAKGEGTGEGNDWEFGVSRCKLLYREWINSKVLLYSTGNSIHYPVINRNGKEYEIYIYICIHIHIYTHIYVTESFCCARETEHCKSTILQ